MLTSRIIGALRLRGSVYAEVENDTSFTATAWALVAVIAFLSQLGAFASTDLASWLIGTVVGTILAILGFAVGAMVINWVGRSVFKAGVSFDELVRVLGLAYVWQVVGVLAIAAPFVEALSSELYLVRIGATVMMMTGWLIASKEALDLGWKQTAISVALGWLAQVAITVFIAILVLNLFGPVTAATR